MIIQGDVIDVLPTLIESEEKYDVIIADPPYNIGKDFGAGNQSMHIDKYISWCKTWIDMCIQLLTENGLLYIYGWPEIIARVSAQYPINKQRWLTWHYTNKVVPQSKFWQRSQETILCLWNPDNKRPQLEVDQIRVPYTDDYKTKDGKNRPNTPSRFRTKPDIKTVFKVHENGALPRDVIKVPALVGGLNMNETWFLCRTCNSKVFPSSQSKHHENHDTFKHPTQKPMALTKQLIQSIIKHSDGKVLIPFAGSGSECKTAQSLGIEYTGIEINPEYVEMANQWLTNYEKIQILDGCRSFQIS